MANPLNIVSAIASGIGSIVSGFQQRGAISNAEREELEALLQSAERLERDYPEASADLTKVVNEARTHLRDASYQFAGDVNRAAQGAGQEVRDASGAANETLTGVRDDITGYNEPYSDVGGKAMGTLGEMLSPDGEFLEKFSYDFEADPGYEFVRGEGMRGIQQTAAGKGMVNSGATLEALTQYGTNLGSLEYDKNIRRAFDMFQTDRAQRFGMLADTAAFGERAAGRNQQAGMWYGSGVSDNTMRGAEIGAGYDYKGALDEAGIKLDADRYWADAGIGAGEFAANNKLRLADIISGNLTDQGNVKAAAHMGRAGAWNQALSGAAGIPQSYRMGNMMEDYFKNGGGGGTPGYAYVTSRVGGGKS